MMNRTQINFMKPYQPLSPRMLLGTALLFILSAAMTGCMVGVGTILATEQISESFTTSAQPNIIVETFNGKINVQVGLDDQVTATVTKTGSGSSQSAAEADLENIDVIITQDGNTIQITARRTGNRLVNNSGAEVELTVPAASTLDLTSSNGKITSVGVVGDLMLRTSNGELTVAGGQGMQNLTTSNGSIHIEALSARLNAQTSNGSITFNGSLSEGDHIFETSNGSIDIKLKGDSQFELDASTSNGRVSTEFPVKSSGTTRDNELRGSVGNNPAISITVRSSNGSIKLLKADH